MTNNSVDDLMIEILSGIEHDVNEPIPDDKKRINWDDISDSDKIPYLDILDDSIPYEFNSVLPQIIDTCFRLPNPKYQTKRLLSFLSCYSLAMNNYPIGAFIGKAGSGKSAMGTFWCDLYGGKFPFNPSGSDITQAAMKRKIDLCRYEYPDSKLYPRSAILYFDDLSPSLLNDFIFTLLKRGIMKGATIEIAAREGNGVISFNIDCPKAFSSVHRVWELPEYQELKRRVLVFNFDHVENLTKNDLSYYQNQNFIPTDSIDFSGLSKDFKDFWHNDDTLEKYKSYKRSLSKVKHDIPRQLFTLSVDVMATGLTCDYYINVRDCINDFSEYWSNHYKQSESEVINILKSYLSSKSEVNPNILRDYLDKKASSNQCDRVNYNQLKLLMTELGYKLVFDSINAENMWIKE